MEDDLYPNDSSYFLPREPVEQALDRKKERAKTLEEAKLLKEAIGYLREQAMHLGSVDAMPAEVKLDPEKFLIMHTSNEIARNIVAGVAEYLDGLLDNSGKREL